MKPIILLTGAHSETDTGRPTYVLNKEYATAVRMAGGLPMLCVDQTNASEYARSAQGLILTGGKDIAPAAYRQPVHPATDCDLARDELELCLLEAFLKEEKPVMGICRGFQLLNVYFGGTLIQHLPDVLPEQHTKGVYHPVQLKHFKALSGSDNSEIMANSYHHQGIEKLGRGLVATGFAGALVEAFAHEALPVWAVQWHPERMIAPSRQSRETPDMLPLFEYFVQACCNSGL